MRRALRLACAALALMSVHIHAGEVHGQTDAFAAPGVALRWAILRGADEARTSVVVRVVTGPVVRALLVKGMDPFTKEEKTLVNVAATAGCLEVRIPRATFSEFPRTEWHLLGSEKVPQLVVYYLGVPDTTPELADEQRLQAYLDDRAPKAANSAGCPRS